MPLSKTAWGAIKSLVFFLALIPFLCLFYAAWQDQLGPNPIQTLHFRLGDWALRFLCLGLALTPLRQFTGIGAFNKFRRMFGLYAFFYASMHILVYFILDLSLSWEALVDEVPKSPYILVGMLTYILLTPLALTSTQGMQKRLGRRWSKLHKLVYVLVLTAVIHFFWLTKADYTQPAIYAGIISLLLLWRVLYSQGWKFKLPTKA